MSEKSRGIQLLFVFGLRETISIIHVGAPTPEYMRDILVDILVARKRWMAVKNNE